MQPVVRFRNTSVNDAEPLARLMTQLGYPTSADQMRDRLKALLADSNYEAIVAETAGQVIGMIGLRTDRGYEYDGVQGRIVALVVDDAFRGKGVGKSLVEAAEQWARDRGAHKITVNTAHNRMKTHEFYRSIGYESTGLRFVKALL